MEDAKLGKMEQGWQAGKVVIGVPLIQPKYPPRRKLTQFEKHFLRGLAVTLGIAVTVYIITLKEAPIWLKIFTWPLALIGPVGTFGCTFNDSSDDESEDAY